MSDVLQNRDIVRVIALNTNDIASLCKLATVSRLFYDVFTSDKVWERFDVYNRQSSIFRHFLEISTQTDLEFYSNILIYEAPFHWYTRYQLNWYAIIDVYANNRDFPVITDQHVLRKVFEITNWPINVNDESLDEIVHCERDLCYQYYSRGKPSLKNCPKEFVRDKMFVHEVIENLAEDLCPEFCDCDSEGTDEVPEMPLEFIEYPLAFDSQLLEAFVKRSSFLKFISRASSVPNLSKHLNTLEVPQSLIEAAICYRPRQHLCAFNSNTSGFFGDPKAELKFKCATNKQLVFETPRNSAVGSNGGMKESILPDNAHLSYTINMNKYYETLGSSVSSRELHKAKLTDFGWALWNNPQLLAHFDWITDTKDFGHLALVSLQRNDKNSVHLVPAYLFKDYDFAMMAIWYNRRVLEQFEFDDPRLLEIQHLHREQNLAGIREIFADYLADTRCGVYDDEDACKYWGPLTNYPRYYINVHCCDKILQSWLGELPDDLSFNFESDSDLGSDPYSAFSD